MKKKLEIKLLGQFMVRVDGRAVVIRLRPAQSLLAYLVLNADRPQPREALAGRFWPDSSEAKARNNLRSALYHIRQALDRAGLEVDRYLAADRFTVSFLSDNDCLVDVHQLDRRGAAAATLEELIISVSYYMGDLLPGFYDDWVMLERRRIQGVLDRKMRQLLDSCTATGRWQAAIEWAERWIALGDVPEYAYRSLMEASAALGDMAGVAQAYQRCRKALAEAVGVEPSKLTEDTFLSLTGRGPAVVERDKVMASAERWAAVSA